MNPSCRCKQTGHHDRWRLCCQELAIDAAVQRRLEAALPDIITAAVEAVRDRHQRGQA